MLNPLLVFLFFFFFFAPFAQAVQHIEMRLQGCPGGSWIHVH